MKRKNCYLTVFVTMIIATLILGVTGCNTVQDSKVTESKFKESTNSLDKKDNDLTESNSNYKIVTVDFEVSSICYFLPSKSLGVFNYNNKYGLINSDGKVIIEPIYEKLSSPSEDYLIAEKNNGAFCVLSTDGQEVSSIEYRNGDIEIKRIMVLSDETCNDGTGEFSGGLAFMSAKNNDDSDIKSICVDTNGQVIFESSVELHGKFVNGVAVGTVDNSDGIDIVAVDKTGKELWRKQANYFQQNESVSDLKIRDGIIVYKAAETGLWGAIDINGKEILDCSYEELTYAGNGKIGFKKYGLWGYIDYDKNVVIEPNFSKAYDFRGGMALVCDSNGQNSFIDENGNTLFVCEEDRISYYENGIVMCNSSKLLDRNGNVLYETDISRNGMGGTANGLSYSGGEIFYEFLRGEGKTNNEKTYKYFRIQTE